MDDHRHLPVAASQAGMRLAKRSGRGPDL